MFEVRIQIGPAFVRERLSGDMARRVTLVGSGMRVCAGLSCWDESARVMMRRGATRSRFGSPWSFLFPGCCVWDSNCERMMRTGGTSTVRSFQC